MKLKGDMTLLLILNVFAAMSQTSRVPLSRKTPIPAKWLEIFPIHRIRKQLPAVAKI